MKERIIQPVLLLPMKAKPFEAAYVGTGSESSARNGNTQGLTEMHLAQWEMPAQPLSPGVLLQLHYK